ncbi:MAG: phosphopantetheine-binding protein [Polyangiaceae bacterium]|nr:phosphopantetheine-binding protein [Polyangiaceae bacterium]
MNEVLEHELRELIVESLMLEDVRPEEIDVEAPLFGSGLGLDSIDALELALAIERRYKVRIEADDSRNRELFASVRALAAYIAVHGRAVAGEVT